MLLNYMYVNVVNLATLISTMKSDHLANSDGKLLTSSHIEGIEPMASKFLALYTNYVSGYFYPLKYVCI